MKGGQVSMEFLIILGFIFVMLIPLILIFYTQSSESRDKLAQNQLRNIGIKLVDEAEKIYYLGGESRSTVRVYFPDHVDVVRFQYRTLTFVYKTVDNTLAEIPVVSNINFTGNISSNGGVHNIRIENINNQVSIRDI